MFDKKKTCFGEIQERIVAKIPGDGSDYSGSNFLKKT